MCMLNTQVDKLFSLFNFICRNLNDFSVKLPVFCCVFFFVLVSFTIHQHSRGAESSAEDTFDRVNYIFGDQKIYETYWY